MALCKRACLFVQQVRDARYRGDGGSYKSFLWLKKTCANPSALSRALSFALWKCKVSLPTA